MRNFLCSNLSCVIGWVFWKWVLGRKVVCRRVIGNVIERYVRKKVRRFGEERRNVVVNEF